MVLIKKVRIAPTHEPINLLTTLTITQKICPWYGQANDQEEGYEEQLLEECWMRERPQYSELQPRQSKQMLMKNWSAERK